MPELPDVEGFRRVLAEHATGRRIEDVVTLDAQVLRGVSAQRLRNALRGQEFREPGRRGKWLVAPVTGGATVLLHFGMTGSLVWEDEEPRHRHDRVVFVFGDGELRYRDMRKLKGLHLARDESEVDRLLADVGPDALEISREELGELLASRRRQLKPVLADQSLLSGLGNLLVDEILWRVKLNPRLPASSLSGEDHVLLYRTMRTVLHESIKAGRVPPRKSWLTGRRDEPSGSCPRCGTTLKHDRVGGRDTVWCPRCQS